MTDAPELLPCPFCGSDPIVSQPKTINGRVHSGTICCSSLKRCFSPHVVFGVHGDRTEAEAAALWNARVPCWSDDMDAAPKDGTTHARGLWVYNAQTGKPMYWQADIGHYDSGDFIGPSGDDFGWRADDYTHWMPLPAPPKEGE